MWQKVSKSFGKHTFGKAFYVIIVMYYLTINANFKYIYTLRTNISETQLSKNYHNRKKCSVKNESQVIIFTDFNKFFVCDSYNCD